MIRISPVGVKEAHAALKKLPPYARAEVQPVIDTTAALFASKAAARAPRDTGNLASDIGWESRPRSLSAVVFIRKAFYWLFQEFGTVDHGARPFLRPTAIDLRPDHQKRLTEGLQRAGEKMAQHGAKHGV